MCLMLYMATEYQIPRFCTVNVTIQEVPPERQIVRQWFSLSAIAVVGAHTGCGCGFPSVLAEHPVEYYEGMFDDSGDREKDLASARELLTLIGQTLASSKMLEFFPVWAGDEAEAPDGVIEMSVSEMKAETFFVNEHYLHRIRP